MAAGSVRVQTGARARGAARAAVEQGQWLAGGAEEGAAAFRRGVGRREGWRQRSVAGSCGGRSERADADSRSRRLFRAAATACAVGCGWWGHRDVNERRSVRRGGGALGGATRPGGTPDERCRCQQAGPNGRQRPGQRVRQRFPCAAATAATAVSRPQTKNSNGACDCASIGLQCLLQGRAVLATHAVAPYGNTFPISFVYDNATSV
mmetsp:Transcript_14320/g.37077  ORF Transcript_14320/g.37077 Transcript_14320/m.37077 type:complete len:207 (-) Transcript_14320:13-633(-)